MTGLPMPNTPLTDVEREVLYWVAEGLSNPEIAVKLVRSESTIKSHVMRLQARLGARSRTHAVKRGYDLGYLTVDELAAYRPGHSTPLRPKSDQTGTLSHPSRPPVAPGQNARSNPI